MTTKINCFNCDNNQTESRPNNDSVKEILTSQGAIYCGKISHWLYPNEHGSNYMELLGCASHSSFANSTEHLNNLIKHFESMDDHEELYLCNIIALLKNKKKI